MPKSNKVKSKEKSTIRWKHILWTFLFTFVISQLIAEITGWTIVSPIIEKITPSAIRICPYPYPQAHNGQEWIRVNLVNDGLNEINPLDVEYELCGMNGSQKAILHTNILKRDEQDFFEIPSKLNTNCSYAAWELEFYADKQGQCYVRLNVTTPNVCAFCRMNVNVYEGAKLIANISYAYPFFESGLEVEQKIGEKSVCGDYADAPNKSELVRIPKFDIGMMQFDPSIPCLRGELNKTWCESKGYQINRC